MNRTITSLLMIMLLISCKRDGTDRKHASQKSNSSVRDSATVELYEKHKSAKISEPFNINDIEDLKFTSGGVISAEQNEFCDSIHRGFFGTYYLIDENYNDELGRPLGGTITVHLNGKRNGWQADDTTQTIWKIHLKSNVISVWDSIHVGLVREEIVKFGQINNGFCIKKGSFYCSCDFNNFSAMYIFKNDTLRELTISRKCK